jgi:hypothetical protein
MLSRLFPYAACLMITLPAGCEEAGNAPDAATRVGGPPGAVRSEDASGVWTQEQVEQYLTQNLKLTTVSLQSTGGANYTGMGVAQDGRTLKLNVRQVPGGIRCDYEDDRGGGGNIAFGNPVPAPAP